MRVVSSYVCQTPGRGANGGLSSARAGTTTPGTPARAARPDSFVAVVRKLRRFIGGTSWRVGAVALFFDVAKHIGIPPAPQSARTIGSVSVRTLTARSPGGRDGWAFGNPRSDRLAVRLNVGKRYACPDVRRRVSEGPPVSPALPAALGRRSRAAKDSRGLPTITADLKPACRRKGGGPPSLPAAHESLAPRVLDPTLSTAEGAGAPATDRRAVGQSVRSGFPRPHPPHPPGGSAAIGSPQFRTETLRRLMVDSKYLPRGMPRPLRARALPAPSSPGGRQRRASLQRATSVGRGAKPPSSLIVAASGWRRRVGWSRR